MYCNSHDCVDATYRWTNAQVLPLLNCSLQVVDGVEIRETKEGKPKVSNFMSDYHTRDDDHPYSLAKVQVMTEGMLSKVMKNVGYSSFYSLSKHVDVNS